MNKKTVLIFAFIFTYTNVIASDSQEDNCSCWELLTCCFIERSDHQNHDFDYIPFPGAKNDDEKAFCFTNQRNEAHDTISDDPHFLICNSNPLWQALSSQKNNGSNITGNNLEMQNVAK